MKFLECIRKATQPQPVSHSFRREDLIFVGWVFNVWQTPAPSCSVDLSSACITLQLFLLSTVTMEGEATSFFNISGKSSPQLTRPLAERWYHSGESNVLLSGFFHSCLVREQYVLSFSHDIWWGEEIQGDFSELPNLMLFCEEYFLPVRNPPISCSFLITKNVSIPFSRSAYFLAGWQHSWRSRTLKERKKNIKWEVFISPQ